MSYLHEKLDTDRSTGFNETSRRFGYCFVPQPIRTRVFKDPLPVRRPTPTAWIDGLRGWAALCVTLCHFVASFHEIAYFSWGTANMQTWLTLPIIRLPFSGHPMVSIFFVVGGYVLSLKSLQLMQANTMESRSNVLQVLSSSVFRRWFRLYLPAMFISLSFLLVTYSGWTGMMLAQFRRSPMFPGYCETSLPMMASLSDHLHYWAKEASLLTNFWQFSNIYPLHDHHLWTLPLEFRASMVLFITLIAAIRLRPYIRLLLLAFVGTYCLWWNRYEVALFLYGACSAQVEILRRAWVAKTENRTQGILCNLPEPSPRWRRWLQTLVLGLLNVLAFWLLSSPHHQFDVAPGYQYLSTLIPSFVVEKFRFMPGVGALLLVNLLGFCPADSVFRKPFTNDVAQYLGSISFALYLVHGPILHAGGYFVPIWIWRVIPRDNTFGFVFGLGLGQLINWALFIAVADVFTREVEMRCVRFTVWLERKCLPSDK